MKSATGLAYGVVGILIVTMAMVANADTFYVNGSCGNDAWTGTGRVCAAPNGPKPTRQAARHATGGQTRGARVGPRQHTGRQDPWPEHAKDRRGENAARESLPGIAGAQPWDEFVSAD